MREQELMAKMNLSEAVAAAERERDEARAKLTSELAVRDSREEQARAAHALERAQATRASDDLPRRATSSCDKPRLRGPIATSCVTVSANS